MNKYYRNDVKLSFNKESIVFFVNEDKKVVTCKMDAELLMPHKYPIDGTIYLDNTFIKGVGVAKCCKEDVFDIERGKRIALAKAESNAYSKARNYTNKYVVELIQNLDILSDFDEKCLSCIEHNEDYIESVSNTEHPLYKKDLKIVTCGVTII